MRNENSMVPARDFFEAILHKLEEVPVRVNKFSIHSELYECNAAFIQCFKSSDQGTEVTVVIPFREPAQPPRRTGSLVSKSVLIVEDVVSQSMMLQDILTRSGAWCEAVSSVSEAAETMAEKNFDVVLLDLRTAPDSTGATTAFIQRHHQDTVIIGMSAYITDDIRNEMLKAGAADVFVKTEHLYDLVDAIRSVEIKTKKRDPLWSMDIYKHLHKTDRAQYNEAMLLLKHECRGLIESLAEHSGRQDRATVMESLHKMLPISRQLKFVRLTAALRSCHDAAERDDWDKVHTDYCVIKQLVEHFLEEI